MPVDYKYLLSLLEKDKKPRRRFTDEEILELLRQRAYTATELAELLDYCEQRMRKILNQLPVIRVQAGRRVYYVAEDAWEKP